MVAEKSKIAIRALLKNSPLAISRSVMRDFGLARQFASKPMAKTTSAHDTVAVEKLYLRRIASSLLEAFNTNNRINQYLIDNLPPAAWKMKPADGKGRTIGAIVAHMHNVRVMWLKAAKAGEIPEQLDRATVTPGQATRALEGSRHALSIIISRALESDGRIRSFRPDVAGFLGYLIAHDAHHRGRITMLARQLGNLLPQKAIFGMWEWGSR